MRYPEPRPVNKSTGLSEQSAEVLKKVMSNRDGVHYTSFTFLNFSRPAICLKTGDGQQKVLTANNAKAIMREERHGES